MSLDFASIKQSHPIEQVFPLLGIDAKPYKDQLRAPCPVCKEGGERALVCTPAKGTYYCFGKCRKGGDVLTLVSAVKGISIRDAAALLAGDEKQKPLAPLDYLDPAHASLQALGISVETAVSWFSGYAPKGIMRGRYAVPIRDGQTLLAYVGIAVDEKEPRYLFPKDFDPASAVFGSFRLVEKETLYLVKEPLDALRASETLQNVVSFCTETISRKQLDMLLALMDAKGIEELELM